MMRIVRLPGPCGPIVLDAEGHCFLEVSMLELSLTVLVREAQA